MSEEITPDIGAENGSHESEHNRTRDDHNESSRSRDDDRKDRDKPDDVCRDYLKNICNRGARCKFYHPPDAVPNGGDSTAIHFCIDFQNRGCMRDNCRFVHVPKEEAERYKATREVTLPLARAIAAVTQGDTINGIPVCKEFQTGKCSRGAARCRYWHVNIDEERERRRRGLPPTGPGPMRGMRPPFPPYGSMGMRRPAPYDDYDHKRPRMDDQRTAELERRNAELQKEVEGLKRELQREHERYEDLYALFRQQTGSASSGAGAPAAGGYGAHGGGHATMGWGGANWSG